MKLTSILTGKLLSFLMIVALFGCAGTRMGHLTDAIDEYNKLLKWGGYSAPASLIDESIRKEFLQKRSKEMKDKSIVEYSVGDISIGQDGQTASALVQYAYIDQVSQSVRGFAEIQIWKHTGNKWYLTKVVNSNETRPVNSNY